MKVSYGLKILLSTSSVFGAIFVLVASFSFSMNTACDQNDNADKGESTNASSCDGDTMEQEASDSCGGEAYLAGANGSSSDWCKKRCEGDSRPWNGNFVFFKNCEHCYCCQ